MTVNGKLVGVGITTYNRFEMFKKCFESLVANSRDVDGIIIIDDCSTIDRLKYDKFFDEISIFKHIRVKQLTENRGVGHAKNNIMKHFMSKDYDYIFTLEDDMRIKSPDIFQTYIDASEQAKMHYINFAEHGTHNGRSKNVLVNGYEMKVYPNIVGAFTLHTKELIEKVGYHDEKFLNAMEHVDYAYRASLADMTTPFWKFCDVANNTDLIEEQAGSINQSSIRVRDDWIPNIQAAGKYWIEKHGVNLSDIPGRW
jgi:GT2 family glycosyltransferase